jgi:GNAT superfamily N-acetyltransferase
MTATTRDLEVQTYDDLNDFAEAALPFLLEDEALNNLPIGVVRFLQRPGSIPAAFLATIRDRRGQVSGVVTLNHGHALVVAGTPPESIGGLVSALRDRALAPPGVFGRPDFARAFAEAWCEKRGLLPRCVATRGAFALRELRRPVPVRGHFSQASLEELPVLVEWTRAFHLEIPNIGPAPGVATLEARIQTGVTFMWADPDGYPTSMAIIGRESASGAAIQFVYTPPELRGQGFASNLVASVCEKILRSGKSYCALFADLENPAATKLYRRLGFDQLSIVEHHVFEHP